LNKKAASLKQEAALLFNASSAQKKMGLEKFNF
jgi:hypothetical protein